MGRIQQRYCRLSLVLHELLSKVADGRTLATLTFWALSPFKTVNPGDCLYPKPMEYLFDHVAGLSLTTRLIYSIIGLVLIRSAFHALERTLPPHFGFGDRRYRAQKAVTATATRCDCKPRWRYPNRLLKSLPRRRQNPGE